MKPLSRVEQEHHRVCDVLRRAEPLHQHLVDHGLPLDRALRMAAVEMRGLDRAGHDRIDGDAIGAGLDRHHAGHAFEAGLGAGIDDALGFAEDRARGNIDDAAELGAPHAGHEALDQHHRRAERDGDDVIELLDRRLFQRIGAFGAGIVDQIADREFGGDVVRDLARRRQIGEVDRAEMQILVLELRRRALQRHHRHTAIEQRGGNGFADAGTGARHHCCIRRRHAMRLASRFIDSR